jgi:hypothetical protein
MSQSSNLHRLLFARASLKLTSRAQPHFRTPANTNTKPNIEVWSRMI